MCHRSFFADTSSGINKKGKRSRGDRSGVRPSSVGGRGYCRLNVCLQREKGIIDINDVIISMNSIF